VKKKSKS